MVPSNRLSKLLVSLLALPLLAGVAAAQVSPNAPELSLGLRLVIGLLVNGVVGLIVVAAAPDYTRTIVDDIREYPGSAFLWGLLALIGGFIVLAIIAVTIIGLIVAIPGFIVWFVVALVGGVIGTVAVGTVLLDLVSDENLFVALFVGIVVTSLVGVVPFVGGAVNFVIGAFGSGAIAKRYWDGRQDDGGSSGSRAAVDY